MSVDYHILLRSLQRKKLEYETALEAINQTFDELGLGISTIVGNRELGTGENVGVQRSGIRIKGELSFRGKDKAEEYFDLVDRDRDNFISYEELRMMEAFNHPYALVKDSSFQSSASWAIAMLNEGIPVQKGMFLNKRAFLKYRHSIDSRQPISRELQVIGMSLMPQYLEHWIQLKRNIREALSSRDFRVTLAAADKTLSDGHISLQEIQEVLGVHNHPLTIPELLAFLRLLRVHRIAQKELLRTYAKRRLAQSDFPFETSSVAVRVIEEPPSRSPSRRSSKRELSRANSRNSVRTQADESEIKYEERLVTLMRTEDRAIETEHLQQAPVAQVMAWILRVFSPLFSEHHSSNLSPLQSSARLADFIFNFGSVGRACLSVRAHATKFVRYCDHIGRFLFDLAGHLNDRLVFRDLSALLYDKQAHRANNRHKGDTNHKASRHAKPVTGLSALPNVLSETSVYKFSVSIGDAAVSSNASNAGGGENSGQNSAVGLSGLSLHWKLARIDSVDSAAKRLGGVPAGAGLVFSLDILCRDPTTIAPPCISLNSQAKEGESVEEEQWKLGANLLRAWLLAQFTDIVCKEHNINFLGANVLYTTSELDDAPVYRILIYYKRLVCMDRWLETLLLPFSLIDLIPACAGDLRTSLDLHRLAHSNHLSSNNINNNNIYTARSSVLGTARSKTSNGSTSGASSSRHHRHGSSNMSLLMTQEALSDGPSLNDLFHCQLTGTVGLRSRLLSALLRRLVCALSSGLSETQTAYLKTQTSSNSNHAGGSSASISSSSSATANDITVNTATTQKSTSTETGQVITKDDEEMRFRRWRSVHPYYAWMHRQAIHWADILRRWQSGTFRWHFRSLYDFFTKLSLTSYLDKAHAQPSDSNIAGNEIGGMGGFGFSIWQYISDELLLSAGALSRTVHCQRSLWKEDLQKMFEDCAKQLSQQRENEQRQRREMLIHGRVINNNNNSNINNSAHSNTISNAKDDSNTSEEYGKVNHVLRLLQETQHLRSIDSLQSQANQTEFERTVQSLRVFELIQRYCIGIHSCEVLCGKSRLTVSGAGLDVCEALLPEAPPMLQEYATHEKDLLKIRSQHKQHR